MSPLLLGCRKNRKELGVSMVCCLAKTPWPLTLDWRNQGSEILRRLLRWTGAGLEAGAGSGLVTVGKVKGLCSCWLWAAAPAVAGGGEVESSSCRVQSGVFWAESAIEGDGEGSPTAMGALIGSGVLGRRRSPWSGSRYPRRTWVAPASSSSRRRHPGHPRSPRCSSARWETSWHSSWWWWWWSDASCSVIAPSFYPITLIFRLNHSPTERGRGGGWVAFRVVFYFIFKTNSGLCSLPAANR